MQPLFALFASASDSQLARMVGYLKAENKILRDRLPRRLTVTPRERNRLVRLGARLGAAIGDLVTPRAFARWVAAGRGEESTGKKSNRIGTRRVIPSGVTANPNSAWVAQQRRNASMAMAELGLPGRFLLRDHDGKFTKDFDAVFEADGAEVKRVGPVAPSLNSYAERRVQGVRTECPDHFLVLGENHLRYLITRYAEHHNEERPHQARGNVPIPIAAAEEAGEPRIFPFPRGEVRCREQLGGLLRPYYRAAA